MPTFEGINYGLFMAEPCFNLPAGDYHGVILHFCLVGNAPPNSCLREFQKFLNWNRSAASGGSRRIGWNFLAMGATELLLAGAIHEVARPLLQAPALFDAQYQERLTLESETTVLKKNLAAYRKMAASQGRRGVAGHLLDPPG